MSLKVRDVYNDCARKTDAGSSIDVHPDQRLCVPIATGKNTIPLIGPLNLLTSMVHSFGIEWTRAKSEPLFDVRLHPRAGFE